MADELLTGQPLAKQSDERAKAHTAAASWGSSMSEVKVCECGKEARWTSLPHDHCYCEGCLILLVRSWVRKKSPLLPETKEGLELDAREEALNDAYAAIVGRYETIKAMPSGEASGLVGQIQGLRVAAGSIVEIPAVVE